jgi:hypothetical protein
LNEFNPVSDKAPNLKILAPTSVGPPKEGLTRHQYILVVDNEKFMELSKTPFGVADFLIGNFGSSSMMVEKIMEGDLHGWHLWLDWDDGEFNKLMGGDKNE